MAISLNKFNLYVEFQDIFMQFEYIYLKTWDFSIIFIIT